MTYADLENSEYGGAPVELFRFAHDTDIWRHSSGSVEVTHDSEIYLPVGIAREDSISVTGEPNKNELTIVMPIDLDVSQLYLNGSPERIVSVTVFRLHEPSGAYEIYWKGRIVSVDWKPPDAAAKCESIFSSIKRQGLRDRYTRSCRHDLYSTGGGVCEVDKAGYAVACTVTAVSGTELSFTVDDSSEYDDGYFMAGMVYFSGAWRFVLSHAAGTVTLMSAFSGLAVDSAVTLYPGCDHTITMCEARFDNVVNFGGWPWIPTKNPFEGSLV
jgi:uncharacterized phage protein (TIGR02218 family)